MITAGEVRWVIEVDLVEVASTSTVQYCTAV